MKFKAKFRLFLEEYLEASTSSQINHPILFAIQEVRKISKETVVPNWNAVNKKLEKAQKRGWLGGLEFSVLMQELLVSEQGYVIDTGNYECVNAEVAIRLVEKIKKHPAIWAAFFMVA